MSSELPALPNEEVSDDEVAERVQEQMLRDPTDRRIAKIRESLREAFKGLRNTFETLSHVDSMKVTRDEDIVVVNVEVTCDAPLEAIKLNVKV